MEDKRSRKLTKKRKRTAHPKLTTMPALIKISFLPSRILFANSITLQSIVVVDNGMSKFYF